MDKPETFEGAAKEYALTRARRVEAQKRKEEASSAETAARNALNYAEREEMKAWQALASFGPSGNMIGGKL